VLVVIVALYVPSVRPQYTHIMTDPGPMTPGQSSSTACGSLTNVQCARDGSSNYVSRSLTYDRTAGMFSGTMVTNFCSNDHWGVFNGQAGPQAMVQSSECVQQTFPAYPSSELPMAAPVRGIVAYSITSGVNVYGPFDAGFTQGFACDNNLGECDAGTDVFLCTAKLEYECGSGIHSYMLLDDCGGHAQPYHYHADLACDYTKSAAGHSALIAVSLDGRGVYGEYETTGTYPTNLDACGGHYGNVPSYTIGGITYPNATNVYHYHTQATAPYTLGCYGPVSSLTQCQSLYTTCGTGFGTYYTSVGCYFHYDLDCPCFRQNGVTYNQVTPNVTAALCTSGTSGGLAAAAAGTAAVLAFATFASLLSVA